MPIVPNAVEPTSVPEIAEIAQLLLRDRPRFFEASIVGNGVGRTYKLPHPLIQPSTFAVHRVAPPADLVQDVDFALDERNGYVTFATTPPANVQFWIEGYYFAWFLDSDLEEHVQLIVNQHAFGRPTFSLDLLSPVEAQAIAIGAIVSALWALAPELSTDIDVGTPEGMNIPASQRFRQVMALIDYWTRRYNSISASLNVGLDRIQMFDLRRISRTTNRLVPLYVAQEIDDQTTPVRIRPPIDTGLIG